MTTATTSTTATTITGVRLRFRDTWMPAAARRWSDAICLRRFSLREAPPMSAHPPGVEPVVECKHRARADDQPARHEQETRVAQQLLHVGRVPRVDRTAAAEAPA